MLHVIDYTEYAKPDYVEIILSNNKILTIQKKHVKNGKYYYNTVLNCLDKYDTDYKSKTFIDNLINAMVSSC